jgi:hypothetical protein
MPSGSESPRVVGVGLPTALTYYFPRLGIETRVV